MNIMVDKETIVSTINNFFRTGDIALGVTLFSHLCEIKNPPNKEEGIKMITNNPVLISFIMENVLVALETEFNLVRITDKLGRNIIVF